MQLFDIDRAVVPKHLQNVFADGELVKSSTCANFAQVADNGKAYQYKFYNLPAIIAPSANPIPRGRIKNLVSCSEIPNSSLIKISLHPNNYIVKMPFYAIFYL